MIYTEVRFDMENSKALITVAYISQSNGNPYQVFCEHIKYCVSIHASRRIFLNDLRLAVEQEFGILFPQNVLRRCLNMLESEGFLVCNQHKIVQKGDFDSVAFDEKRRSFQDAENHLIERVIAEVTALGKTWDESYAKQALSKFLQAKANAFDIFYHGNLETFNKECNVTKQSDDHDCEDTEENTEDKSKASESFISDQWFVGNCIRKIIAENGREKRYLEDVVKGLMICIGAYQLPDDDKLTRLNIKNTEFYFDTKLLLRLLGCAWSEAVESTQELVKLIQMGEGRIYYFPHTLREVSDALERAEDSAKNGSYISDKEMAYYLRYGNVSASTLKAKRLSIEKELGKLKIYKRELREWDEDQNLKFGVDCNDLFKYISGEQPQWDSIAIENDIESIREVHMLRKGNYQNYYGTADKLPVFVTSNTRFVSLILDYGKIREQDKRVSQWRNNRLPIVTDMRLTCRLWNPVQDRADLPLLRLAAGAVAAQQPTPRYFAQLKQAMDDLVNNVPAYANIPVSEFCDDEVTEIVVKQTQGCIDKLDQEVLASSLEEYTRMRLMDEQSLRKEVEEAKGAVEEKLKMQTDGIVEASVQKYQNKLRGWGVLLRGVRNWDFIVAFIFVVLTSIFGVLSSTWIPLIAILIPVGLMVAERVIGHAFIKRFLLKKLVPHVEKKYKDRVSRKLTVVEKQYEKQILERCVEESKSLKMAKAEMEK